MTTVLCTQAQLDAYKTSARIKQEKKAMEAAAKDKAAMIVRKEMLQSKLAELDLTEIGHGIDPSSSDTLRIYYLNRIADLTKALGASTEPVPLPDPVPAVPEKAPEPVPTITSTPDRTVPVSDPSGKPWVAPAPPTPAVSPSIPATAVAVLENGLDGVSGAVAGIAAPGQLDAKSDTQPDVKSDVETERALFDPPIPIPAVIPTRPSTPDGHHHERKFSFAKDKPHNTDDHKRPSSAVPVRISSPLSDENIVDLIAGYKRIDPEWKGWSLKRSSDLIVRTQHESSILESYRARLSRAEIDFALDVKKRFK